MIGKVDNAGRALLRLPFRGTADSKTIENEVWIDTAFDGELVASESLIHTLELEQSAAVEAILADGKKVVLETYSCEIEWRESWRQVEVIANQGELPLLGIGLLKECQLFIDYPNGKLNVD